MSSGMASVVEPAKTDNNLDAVTFDTTDAQTVRPYSGLLVTRLCVPLWGSSRPSLGIVSSLRGDFEIPPLGFFRPTWGGRFSSHQYGTASHADCPHRGGF